MSLTRRLEKLKETYLALRFKEMKHRLSYPKSDKQMAQAMVRFKNCHNKKRSSQIKKEVDLCKRFWRCYPLHYYRYGFYRKDKELSENELLGYIPEFFFYSLFLPFHNSKKYEILLHDKIVTQQLFGSLKISQAHTICKLMNNHIYTNELNEISYDKLRQELIAKKYQKIFVKPANGEGGYGLFVFNRNNIGEYVTRHNKALDEDFLNKIRAKNDYIIQTGLEQHPQISKIYPNSVNTLRIVTENKEGYTRALCCELRIGRDGAQTDNFCQGGIIVKVDINTGELADYAVSEEFEYFHKHPNTNFVFKGSAISTWEKVKECTIEFARKLPQFVYLGWDIALTKSGPVAIEAHPCFGLDGIQFVLGGLRDIFQISDPRFYWENKGKKI